MAKAVTDLNHDPHHIAQPGEPLLLHSHERPAAVKSPFKTEIQIVVVVEDKLLDDEASHTHPRSSENTYVREEFGGEGRRIDKRDLT